MKNIVTSYSIIKAADGKLAVRLNVHYMRNGYAISYGENGRLFNTVDDAQAVARKYYSAVA